MARVRENIALAILQKHGVNVPSFSLWPELSRATGSKYALKANEVVSSRQKIGLVKLDLAKDEIDSAVEEIKRQGAKQNLQIESFLIAEFIPHDAEFYLAARLVRGGVEILFNEKGGVGVESEWEKTRKCFLDFDTLDKAETPLQSWASLPIDNRRLLKFIQKLLKIIQSEDILYLEINPFTIVDDKIIALAAVMEIDEASAFRHPKLSDDSTRSLTERELRVKRADELIGGSVKLVEIPNGDTAILTAGAGASLFYADAVIKNGGKLANYAEYSGAPPAWAVQILTEAVSEIPGIKRLLVGGGIANFTNVALTFDGIINGLKNSKSKGFLSGVKIYVRRGGPNEEEGLEMMRKLKDEGFDIAVYDRNLPLTEIVNLSLSLPYCHFDPPNRRTDSPP